MNTTRKRTGQPPRCHALTARLLLLLNGVQRAVFDRQLCCGSRLLRVRIAFAQRLIIFEKVHRHAEQKTKTADGEENRRRAKAGKESAELAADEFEDQQMRQLGQEADNAASLWSSENARQDAEKRKVERVENRRN